MPLPINDHTYKIKTMCRWVQKYDMKIRICQVCFYINKNVILIVILIHIALGNCYILLVDSSTKYVQINRS